jgi:DNA-binding CsgD family transcriptional regulator
MVEHRSKPLSIDDIEMRLKAACPILSGRERSVCARTVAGVTAEGIAIDLGIKQSSVLTYRRRAYERLNISTAHQLSAMLLR